jgi:hypothetical protein
MDPESLITQSPEACAFLEDAKNRASEFYLYPEEVFTEIEEVCLGGTGTDLQGETHSLEGIRQSKRIWPTVLCCDELLS